ncbi:hypothetical protein GOP47_0019841 [Adiantum capillus-veneris]|uniref:Complex III subunit VI n=1 Tax=Adiantum capillus-veneris TaxID=13818 RepID=A0A9D4UDG6_ADICA|nr:hypothetical protein GOP47_0019841 [Adiantum capillus-veneris]
MCGPFEKGTQEELCAIQATMSDEGEVVDPRAHLDELSKPKCVKQLMSYKACVKRIEGDTTGHKHCTGQYFDYWACIDKNKVGMHNDLCSQFLDFTNDKIVMKTLIADCDFKGVGCSMKKALIPSTIVDSLQSRSST